MRQFEKNMLKKNDEEGLSYFYILSEIIIEAWADYSNKKINTKF
ncbi:hypothetical protein LPTSP3_g31790 [Leptospira kobayashii]|uniref:Uncharacterized protein n=1 Tax=Leptospira kobayashii TaxID=1917830 RepID=A0ABM7UMF9_9LEPT|nr:hypothetical protein LPTSP3_g31790 [Leptospira kobayashii]